MRVFESLDSIPADEFARGTVVAIGKFDGLHRGHRALLRRLLAGQAAENLEPVVFTFANNPLSLLRPDKCPHPIMSKQQRLDMLGAEGIDACVMVPFDAEFAAISAEDFVQHVLVELLHAKRVCVGADFTFGRGGVGNTQLLTAMGEKLGFQVEIIIDVQDAEIGRVSSSRVREAILQGDVAAAGRMLDRPVSLHGEVVRGDARGRELGFPTANLGGEVEGLRPADGVYAGWAIVRGVRHQAAISVGANVTFESEGEPRVEAYLIDFEGDLYGERIELLFARRLRGMVAFTSVEALVARMREDVREAREALVR